MAKENKPDVLAQIADASMSESTSHGKLFLVALWTIGLPIMLLYVIFKYSTKVVTNLFKKMRNKKREVN